jgi:hypothetical protein
MLDKHKITISNQNYAVTPFFASGDGSIILPPLEESATKLQAALLVYDVDNAASFAAIPTIYERILNAVNAPHQRPRRKGKFPVALAAANADVPMSARGVTVEQGMALARAIGCDYVECSAKEGFGVHPIFDTLVSAAASESELEPTLPPTPQHRKMSPMKVKKASRRSSRRTSDFMWKGQVYRSRASYLFARLFGAAEEEELSGGSFRVLDIREDRQSSGLRPVTPDPRLKLDLNLPGPTILTPWSEHSGFRQRLSALNPFSYSA